MTTSEQKQIQPETNLQVPNLGIERIEAGETVIARVAEFPWLSADTEINTSKVTLETGETLFYGSLIQGDTGEGGNGTLRKLASRVPSRSSANAESGLFKALPTWLHGKDHPNIDVVHDPKGSHKLYKVAKRGNDVARLVFARVDINGTPAILKVGISNHKDQTAMDGIIANRKKRQKHDG